MDDIEYFTCECVYHKYGYVLCPTCADILGARKRSIFVNRWQRRKQCDSNDCQQTESTDLNGTIPKHDN